MTLIAWATAGPEGIEDIGFLPSRLTADGLVHPLELNTPESDAVVGYLEKCHGTQRLTSRIVSENSVSLAGFETLRVIPG